jgi:hypothetical protein
MAEPTLDPAYVKTVADLYGEAVVAILRSIARRMDAGLDDTAQRAKLADLLGLRAEARQIAATLVASLDTTIAATVGEAYDRGAAAAATDLAAAAGVTDAVTERAATRALVRTKRTTVEALGRALSGHLRDLPILRVAEDAYRAATAAAVVPAAAGVETRRQATQRALDRLATQGIGGFTDQSGRRWALDSYAEMSTRTAIAQAAVQGSVDRIATVTPFGRVSDSADECEVCRPWEGKVLLLVPPSHVPEEYRHVEFEATLREAIRRGLMHPNCTHSVGAFIPGLTRTNAQRPAASNPQGYADRQRQRTLERHVRDWKRRQAVAITPQAQRDAATKVQAWTSALAEHVERTNRPRRRDREVVRT